VENKPVIISACLMGIMTRYNGCSSYNADAVKEAGSSPIPVCPEQLGGLPTPRTAALLEGGSGEDVLDGKAEVLNLHGTLITSSFIRGAEAVVEIARMTGAKKALLKERSPSCGVKTICRGARSCNGMGVTAALLKRSGIKVIGF